ncbi:class I SAM-dependent methyltransferase [Neorhizobium sp. T786]|uniref:class I SAM-dependent DNA methyltransferase n=1 Tax=Pseudorhizobium xiangyangii TaxID=2883104 RepID=UPI001D001499|nr:class I SAM-dependent methyltransferase [Neorhizobium xiangyangii]MCB5201489.1 class I SAM-dependent methyltransferase [Neorhizobium xiangyangii]
MKHSDATGRFYAENAQNYARHTEEPSRHWLDRFLRKLSSGAEILELGCGNGRDSAEMIRRGFRVTPTDGTPEMAAEASRRLGIPVPVLRFDQIEAVCALDGIWANACLLHVPRAELDGVFHRIHRALSPGGVFYASFKAGEAEGLDALGRYYNYPSEAWLRRACQRWKWAFLELEISQGGAYDKQPTVWLHLLAVKA